MNADSAVLPQPPAAAEPAAISCLVVGNFLSGLAGRRQYCEDLADRLERSGHRVMRASARPNRLFRLAGMVGAALSRSPGYDVACIDVFSGPAFLWAEASAAAVRHLRRPYVLALRGGGLPAFAGRWPRRVGALLRGAARVTAPSAFLAHELRSYRSGIVVIPNALDLARYAFRLRSAPAPRLVWLRAFVEHYNPRMAVRVLRALAGDFPAARLTMIGSDRGDGSLQRTRKLAAELGVAGCVEFVGGVDKSEVPAWLNRGDIFLNTTNVDNTPVSMMEAAACGLCVVSTTAGGIPHLLRHEQDALLVPCGDDGAMAEQVRRLIDHRDLAQTISRNGRAAAECRDWSRILPRWEELLRSAADNGKQR